MTFSNERRSGSLLDTLQHTQVIAGHARDMMPAYIRDFFGKIVFVVVVVEFDFDFDVGVLQSRSPQRRSYSPKKTISNKIEKLSL